MTGSLAETDRCFRSETEPLSWSVGAGERWLLIGVGLGDLAERILQTSDATLVVVSPRIEDLEPLLPIKRSRERDRIRFLCMNPADLAAIEPHGFDGVASQFVVRDGRRILRPGGRVVTLSS